MRWQSGYGCQGGVAAESLSREKEREDKRDVGEDVYRRTVRNGDGGGLIQFNYVMNCRVLSKHPSSPRLTRGEGVERGWAKGDGHPVA